MKKVSVYASGLVLFAAAVGLGARAEPQSKAQLPPAAKAPVDFLRDIKPILDQSCIQCHAGDKRKGGFSINNRDSVLFGGENGKTVELGNSSVSRFIHLVAAVDPEEVMPPKGDRLTAEQVGVLRAWIDQGLPWPESFSYKAEKEARLAPRKVELPGKADKTPNPVDRLLEPYFKEKKVKAGPPVSDRLYARRVYLDLIGLLPTPQQLDAFEKDKQPDKRARLVDALLDNRLDYATHWLTCWNDMLRNAYMGTGFIDGGRMQLTGWLFKSLYDNKPFDQFVRELVDPVPGSEAFTKGIQWRGVVNASQRTEMQTAQSLSQVFFGLNLKCASCHDSPISEWRLTDSYALAGVFAKEPLDIHRCDKPIGKKSQIGFIYPQLGQIDATAPLEQRRKQLAALVTSPQNGRLTRTIVNRLWATLLGRGIVEPVDEMDARPWNADLLDFLAADLQEHGYDLKHTLKLICTSAAYQQPSVGAAERLEKDYVFRGPHVRRMTAEQFIDALSQVTGVWQEVKPIMVKPGVWKQDGAPITRINEALAAGTSGQAPAIPPDRVRVALTMLDPLQTALGRPNRDQVVTRRDSAATTLQTLELTNGATLDTMLRKGAGKWMAQGADLEAIYQACLGRKPAGSELKIARTLTGSPATAEGIADLLWSLTMLPEFQLIF